MVAEWGRCQESKRGEDEDMIYFYISRTSRDAFALSAPLTDAAPMEPLIKNSQTLSHLSLSLTGSS